MLPKSCSRTPAARVEWLAKGLRHAELMLKVAEGYEQAVDTGDKNKFVAAYHALKDFRRSNADYDKTYFAGLTGDEPRWEKLTR